LQAFGKIFWDFSLKISILQVSDTDYEEDRIITDTQNAIKSGNKHIAVFFPKEVNQLIINSIQNI